ncbi:MAG: hypothetical protein ACO3OI_06490 [Ilumatobacteraceae bacterium]
MPARDRTDNTTEVGLLDALLDAYQGEIFGVAMYRRVTESLDDPWQRWQWECLTRVEVELRDELAAALVRLGHTAIPDEGEHAAGLAEAERIVGLPWLEMLHEFTCDLPPLVERYSAIAVDHESAVDVVGCREVLDRLVRHEVASIEFHRGELAGRAPIDSIGPVVDLLTGPIPDPPIERAS